MFDNLDEIITDLCIKYNNIDVCIIGDLNARKGNASDVLEMSQNEIELIDEYVPHENMNIPGNRVSFDNTVNNYDTRLLTLCKSLYMFILFAHLICSQQLLILKWTILILCSLMYIMLYASL